ncbi:MAG TPA: FAD-dependent oxidoreductase [Deltaproteobacteria bacterium]|nr:FAD-dependent oxidoreductase [Deltaproteobacteria bacterium]HIO82893.1 FAD-dependent oxidoreductase [Deltaproteobacteria bacterium]
MNISLPKHGQIIVIGGGIMGCSTAYHLIKNGCRDVILLERAKLTSGTTWHSAAQVRQLRSTESLTRLVQNSVELYSSLEAETGQATGWKQTGSLSIATNPDRLTHIRRQASLSQAFGIGAEEISVNKAAEKWPLMRTDDLIGAVYSPSDGRVSPSDICAALIKGAKSQGLRVFEDTPVTGIRSKNGRVAAVKTAQGEITCETIVNCAGIWGRSIAAMVGVAGPLHACEHFYLLTELMDSVTAAPLPTLSDHDGHLYLRDEGGGLLVGCFEPQGKALDIEQLPEDFAFDLLPEDWEHIEPILANAMHRIPELEQTGVKMLLNGPESFTPDDRFLLGESPELRGFFLGCGMCSVGIATGGGAGRALAEWIIDGEPSMDLWPVDIRRFVPAQNTLQTLRERSPETLALHYAVSFPGRQYQTARNLRLSPLHSRLETAGAEFAEQMGWERPRWFNPESKPTVPELSFEKPGWHSLHAEEHRAAREAVVLFDQSTFGKLLVQGRDAESALQRLCANDISKADRRVVYTAMLNRRGGYESDLTLMRLDTESFLLVTGTGQPVRDKDWIRRNLYPDEYVTVTDMTGAYAVISIAGPNSRGLLTRISSDDFSNSGFPFYTHRTVEVGSAMVRAARLSYIGELGWELYIPSESALPVFDAIRKAGDDLGLKLAGIEALSSLRIEKGYCAWGHEIGPDDTPLQAGLEFAVKFNKPDSFLGKEALLKQKTEGVSRRLVMLTVTDSEAHPHGGEPIWWNNTLVGRTTSGTFGHTVGCAVMIGYIGCTETKLVTMLNTGNFEVEIACRRFTAHVTLDAPYDPKGLAVRK